MYAVGLFGLTFALVFLSQQAPAVDLEWTEAIAQPSATLDVRTLSDTPPYVWWEAEDTRATNFPETHAFSPTSFPESAVLSGGDWVGVDGDRADPLFLEYDITLPDSHAYYFYSRKFWKHGPFRWRWDDQPWQTADQFFLMDSSPIRPFVVANWVPLGQVSLLAGRHTLRIELLRTEGAAAFDCFVLTQAPIRARGKLKPDQRYTADIPGWFVFDPDDDPFAESLLDLRGLNEPIAGANGWIRAQDGAFVQGRSDTPVRFWGINVGSDVLTMDDATMAQAARFFAKQGINIVRYHGRITPPDQMVLDERAGDRLLAWIHALKQEGIYTGLSLYFPLWYRFPDLGYSEQPPFGLMFWNADLQQRYRSLWQTLLQRSLPNSTRPLAQDPTLAFVELVNEDSLLFWTFDLSRIPAQHQDDLAQQFGTWLTQTYGSIDAALARWNPTAAQEARLGADRVAVVSAWAMAAQYNNPRIQDTAAFLGDRQTQFFQQTRDYLTQDLGYGGLVMGSNWITANPRRLGPLDKYTNTVGDFMDRHGYFGGKHEGATASYTLTAGDVYRDQSALVLEPSLRDEERLPALPVFDIRYNDKPATVSELNWAMPNRFRADFPVLAATYGSLHNLDGFFFFASHQPSWESSLGKFAIASPVVMGQFPAAAWIYRQGLVQPGAAIATVERPIADIQALKGTPLVPPENLDALREADRPDAPDATPAPSATPPTPRFDPMTFLVGPVDLRFTETASHTQLPDLTPYHDTRHRQIHSITQQLTWDYDDGLMTLNTPQAQGATGFLNHAGRINLNTLTLQSDMPYGSVLLVSFDGQPLDRAQTMLLQVMSADENFGWRTNTPTDAQPDKHLLTPGTAPLVVQTLAGTVSLHRPDANRLTVTPLNSNGQPQEPTQTARHITLQPTTFYYWITAEPEG